MERESNFQPGDVSAQLGCGVLGLGPWFESKLKHLTHLSGKGHEYRVVPCAAAFTF